MPESQPPLITLYFMPSSFVSPAWLLKVFESMIPALGFIVEWLRAWLPERVLVCLLVLLCDLDKHLLFSVPQFLYLQHRQWQYLPGRGDVRPKLVGTYKALTTVSGMLHVSVSHCYCCFSLLCKIVSFRIK